MWRLALESNGEIRTSRCTPTSERSRPKAFSPATVKVADFKPASSPGIVSVTTALKPSRSAQRRYMRSSISVQSWASVPPAPACRTTIALRWSFSPESSASSSTRSARCRSAPISDSMSALTASPSRASSNSVSRSASACSSACPVSTAANKRLRSCIIFLTLRGIVPKSRVRDSLFDLF